MAPASGFAASGRRDGDARLHIERLITWALIRALSGSMISGSSRRSRSSAVNRSVLNATWWTQTATVVSMITRQARTSAIPARIRRRAARRRACRFRLSLASSSCPRSPPSLPVGRDRKGTGGTPRTSGSRRSAYPPALTDVVIANACEPTDPRHARRRVWRSRRDRPWQRKRDPTASARRRPARRPRRQRPRPRRRRPRRPRPRRRAARRRRPAATGQGAERRLQGRDQDEGDDQERARQEQHEETGGPRTRGRQGRGDRRRLAVGRASRSSRRPATRPQRVAPPWSQAPAT